jgi:hypothetical protein
MFEVEDVDGVAGKQAGKPGAALDGTAGVGLARAIEERFQGIGKATIFWLCLSYSLVRAIQVKLSWFSF